MLFTFGHSRRRGYVRPLLHSMSAVLALLLGSPRLESDLTGPGYELDAKVRIQLGSKEEMKKCGKRGNLTQAKFPDGFERVCGRFDVV